MKKLILSFVIAMSTSISAQNWPSVKPPIAEKQEFVRVIHGDEVKDPYYWMIDYFTKGKDSTKVVNYLKDENTYWETMMKDTEPLRNELFQEMKARIKEKDESVPTLKNGYYYYTKTENGKQYYKYCRKKGNLNAPEGKGK